MFIETKKVWRSGLGMALLAITALVIPPGVAPIHASPDEPGRIVNGEDIDIEAAPWQVALVAVNDDDTYDQFCGGSIYDETWIITAAHCFDEEIEDVNDFGATYLRVIAGQTDIEGLDPDTFNVVEQIVVHPDFVEVDDGDDVALLRLETPLTLNGTTIAAINMPVQNPSAWPAEGTEGWSTGWGGLRSQGTSPSTLQGISLQVLGGPDDDVCGDYGTGVYEDSTFDPDTMVCVGPLDGAEDGGACQGDSGGPFAINDGGDWYLAGITSWGIGCGNRLFVDGYAPLEPTRVLSTRASDGGDGPIEPGTEIEIDLADDLPENAVSAMVNLTATNARGDGYLVAYGCAAGPPGTSNLNYVGVTTIANTAIIELDDDMEICVRAEDAATDVLVDLVGYFTSRSGYFGLDEPNRVASTRISDGGTGPVAAGEEIEIEFKFPAEALVLNVTATNAQGDGYLTVYYCDDERPDTSNVNYVGITTVANTVIVRSGSLDEANRICISVEDAATDILVDHIGDFEDSSLNIGTPDRLLSTRVSDGGAGPVAADDELRVQVIRREQVPALADIGVAAVLNITATNALGDGYLTAYPCGEDPPGTSNLNYVGVDTIAGLSVVEIGDDGGVCIFVGDAATDILVDAMGSFAPTGGVTMGDFPGVYTRVTTYQQWILDNIAANTSVG